MDNSNIGDHKKLMTDDKQIIREREAFRIPGNLIKKLYEKALKSDLKTFSFLISGLILLVKKYSGERDLDIELYLGKDTNKLNLLSTRQLPDNISFKSLSLQVINAIRDVVNDNKHTLKAVIENFCLSDSAGINLSLSNISIMWESMPDDKDAKFSNDSIIISFTKNNDCIDGDIVYSLNINSRSDIKTFIKHYTNALSNAISNLDASLLDIEFLTLEEKNTLLYDFNHTDVEYPRNKTIVQWFEEQAEKTPDKVAVSSPVDLNNFFGELNKNTPWATSSLRRKLETICFIKNPYLTQTFIEVKQRGNTHLCLLKTHHQNSLIINYSLAQFLQYFDGKKNLLNLYNLILKTENKKGGPIQFKIYATSNGDEISFKFKDKLQVFTIDNQNGFNDFLSLIELLYDNCLIKPVAINDNLVEIENGPKSLSESDSSSNNVINLKEVLFKNIKKQRKVDVLLLGDSPGLASTGLLYLGSYLMRHGVKVRCQFYDSTDDYKSMGKNIEELLTTFHPGIVGISLKWFIYISRVLDICSIIKKYAQKSSQNIKTVLGGDTASYYWEDLTRYGYIDYVIRGDGEEPLLKLCLGEDETNIPNLAYKKNGKIVSNPITYTQNVNNSLDVYLSDLGNLLLSPQTLHFGTFFIYTQKGCNMDCCYCGGCNRAQKRNFNRRWIFKRGVEEIRKDIREVIKYTSTLNFEFDFIDKNLHEYCGQCWEGIDLSDHFCFFSTLTPPSDKLIELVSRTFKYVYWHLDITTLSERHRKQMVFQKLVKPLPSDEDIIHFMKKCENHENIEVRFNLINGLPYFTPTDIKQGEEFLSKIEDTFTCFNGLQWARLHAQPGAPINHDLDKFNMHSYATNYQDFLDYSKKNFSHNSKYTQLEDFDYPYIYYNDDNFNSRITNHYIELEKKFKKHSYRRQRHLTVDRTLTYCELNSKADQLANKLKSEGIKPGEIIGLMLEPSPEIPIGILGVLKNGCAYLPIDPEVPAERVQYILKDSNAAALITTHDCDKAEKNIFEGVVFYLEDISNNVQQSVLGNSNSSLAYVIYTSGTTGKPKGVTVTQKSLVNYISWFSKKASLTQNDKTILTSSFAFDLGYTSLFTSILNGGELHILPRETYLLGNQLLGYIWQKGITYIKMTPSLFSVITSSPDFSKEKCASLRLAVLGGESINLQAIEKANSVCNHLQIMNHYGPTEATIGCISWMVDFERFEDYKKHPVIGKPIDNARAYILSSNLQPMLLGVPGELCISGECLSEGYLNDPGLTAEKFVTLNQKMGDTLLSERVYKTGDLARRLNDGTIEYLGRIDSQIKIRGYRVELSEVESLLKKHPQIKEAAVIAKEPRDQAKKWDIKDKIICAYIVPKTINQGNQARSYIGGEILTLKEIETKSSFKRPPDDFMSPGKEDLRHSVFSYFEKLIKTNHCQNEVAVESEGQSLTYEALYKSASRVATEILKEYDDHYSLSKAERIRYSRQMALYDWGIQKQEKLKASTVFVAGAGGGASAIVMQLALAGVGTIKVCDYDVVELSNLNRQFLHNESRIGMNKALSTQLTIADVNPNIKIIPNTAMLTRDNVEDIVGDSDMVFDMLDNPTDKFMLSEFSVKKGIPHLILAMTDMNAYAAVLHTPYTPCYHCIFSKKKLEDLVNGVQNYIDNYSRNPLPVVSSSLFISSGILINEAIKILLGFNIPAYNTFFYINQRGATPNLVYSAGYRAMVGLFSDFFLADCKEQGFDWDKGWRGNFLEELKMKHDPNCPVCGIAAVKKLQKTEANSGKTTVTIDIKDNRRKREKDKKSNNPQLVAILLGTNINMAVGILGTLKSGKTYTLLDPQSPDERLSYILEESGTRVILTDIENQELAERLKSKINNNIKIIVLNKLVGLYEDIKNTTNQDIEIEVSPDQPAYILFSLEKPQGNVDKSFIIENQTSILDFVRNYNYNFRTGAKEKLDSDSQSVLSRTKMDLLLTLLNKSNPYMFNNENLIMNLDSLTSGLKQYLPRELPSYMLPSQYIVVRKMPLTNNGKVDRNALINIEPENDNKCVFSGPRNAAEKKLVEMWSEILGIEKNSFGIDTNYFELGGHSLNAMILVVRIKDEFKLKISISDLFINPTIRGLSEQIDEMMRNQVTI